eukprot:9132132-Pyramimonas_sp.AAC.1
MSSHKRRRPRERVSLLLRMQYSLGVAESSYLPMATPLDSYRERSQQSRAAIIFSSRCSTDPTEAEVFQSSPVLALKFAHPGTDE